MTSKHEDMAKEILKKIGMLDSSQDCIKDTALIASKLREVEEATELRIRKKLCLHCDWDKEEDYVEGKGHKHGDKFFKCDAQEIRNLRNSNGGKS